MSVAYKKGADPTLWQYRPAVAKTRASRYVVLTSTPGAAAMRAVLFLVVLLAARRGPGPETLPDATVLVDSGAHELVIQLPPVDVPAAGSSGETMVGLPLCQVLVPVDASLHSSRVEVVDGSGRLLPHEMLHHFNLSDPEHRELFLPIGLHLLAMSRETPTITIPRLLFGLPLARGQRLIAGAMLANRSEMAYRRLHVRLVLHVIPAHRYRLTAVYENPTGRHIRDGGMGAVAGLFVPDHGAVWPAVDTRDSLYQQDLAATIRSGSAEMMADMMMGHHDDP